MLRRQELADHLADDRGTPQASAHQHFEAERAAGVALEVQPDVVDLGRGTIRRRAGDRDLELARQVGEFRVQRRPLAHDLAPRARILDLVGGDAREMIGGDVAHAIAAGLHGVHLHAGQLREDVRHVFQLRPVQLQVLARGEVAEAAVVAARDGRERAQLVRREQPVGNRDAQHRRVALHVQAVAQAQRLEFVLGELAREETPRLVAKLRDTLIHERLVDGVVAVHLRRL